MTRIALIADIHGNAVALRHALDAIDRLDVDRIVCLGDVSATGPQPVEAVSELRARDIPTVMGNADAEILDPSDPTQEDEPMNRLLEMCAWGNQQLSSDDRAFLSSFPDHIEIDLGDAGTLLCVHGSPQSFDDPIWAETDATELDRMLAGHEAAYVVAGHTHFQLLRRHRHQTLINPGSIGRSYDPAPPAEDVQITPRAEFAIIETGAAGFTCRFERLPYDPAPLLDAALSSGMPHADWWTGMWQRSATRP